MEEETDAQKKEIDQKEAAVEDLTPEGDVTGGGGLQSNNPALDAQKKEIDGV